MKTLEKSLECAGNVFRNVPACMEGRGARNAALAIATMGLLLVRRWQQFARPQVWDEEGAIIVREFAERGLGAFITPVHDYYVLVSKIVSWLAMQVSFVYYPQVSTLLTALTTVGIVLAIANSPTMLRGKYLCALLVLMVPSNPEVFAVTLYLFWWSSLLLFLLCLWDPERPHKAWRIFFAVLAGLSGPAILLVLPVLWLRVVVFRAQRVTELPVTIVASGAAAVQLIPVLTKQFLTGKFVFVEIAQNLIPKYFGYFAIGHWAADPILLWLAGGSVLAVVLGAAIHERRRFAIAVIVFLLLGAIALACVRISPADAHPATIGPRYFFFPFVLLYWALVQVILAEIKAAWPAAATVVLAGALLNSLPVLSRGHVDLKWKSHALSCPHFAQYQIPIQYDGTGVGIWYLPISGATCERLLANDYFYRARRLETKAVVPYVVVNSSQRDQPVAQLISDDMRGSDFQKSTLPGLVTVGSFVHSDQDRGFATFKVRRGERLFYRSGPRTSKQQLWILGSRQHFIETLPVSLEWVTLDFSNRRLPDEFTVRVIDDGTGYGEWSAFAARPARTLDPVALAR
jgi:hypothetical protein